MLVANFYIKDGRRLYVRGECIPEEDLSADKLERLKKIGAVIDLAAPVVTEDIMPAPVAEEDILEVDAMEGIKKPRRRKKVDK